MVRSRESLWVIYLNKETHWTVTSKWNVFSLNISESRLQWGRNLFTWWSVKCSRLARGQAYIRKGYWSQWIISRENKTFGDTWHFVSSICRYYLCHESWWNHWKWSLRVSLFWRITNQQLIFENWIIFWMQQTDCAEGSICWFHYWTFAWIGRRRRRYTRIFYFGFDPLPNITISQNELSELNEIKGALTPSVNGSIIFERAISVRSSDTKVKR